jgi:two-component system response regulator FixJ
MTTPPKILIVDDDPMMVKTLSDILEFQGYQTVTANSATEALDRASCTTFDCLFSDIRMPGMNGVELHQAIRDQLGDIPTALMTAYSETQLVRQGIDAGVVAIFTKPLDLDILFRFLQALPDQLSDFAGGIGQSSLGKVFTARNFGPGRTMTRESPTPRRHRCASP